jgi:preprotein translocase subunit SecB
MTQPFTIRQIYLKDLSFQAPAGAAIFSQEWSPQVKVDLKLGHSALGDSSYEVVLTISIVATSGGSTAFMIEVLQAGVFQLIGFSDAERESVLTGKCPGILYPYARETVDAVLMKGRFPALILEPIDFEANQPGLARRS